MVEIVDKRTANTKIFDELEQGDFFEYENRIYIKTRGDGCVTLNGGWSSGIECHFLPFTEVTKLKVIVTIEGAE